MKHQQRIYLTHPKMPAFVHGILKMPRPSSVGGGFIGLFLLTWVSLWSQVAQATSTLRRYMRWLLLPLLVLGGLPGALAQDVFSIPAPASALKTQAVKLDIPSVSGFQSKVFPMDIQNIYGLSITVDFHSLYNSSDWASDDFSRVVLIDNSTQQEYLVSRWSRDPRNVFITGSSFDRRCEETCVLPELVNSFSLKLEAKGYFISVSEISYVDTPISGVDVTELRRQQNAVVIQKFNEQDLGWIAGETSVSNLTYAEKKRLVNLAPDQGLNLQGFEYYRGGIFEVHSGSSTTKSGSTRQSALVDSFDWHNRPGPKDPKTDKPTKINWVTSVKDQNPCGSCAVFATTGAVEAVTNLYFNQHLDLDLSEQEVVSCSSMTGIGKGKSNCDELNYNEKGEQQTGRSWLPKGVIDDFKNRGFGEEACFVYQGHDLACGNKCQNPTELIKVGGSVDFPSKIYGSSSSLPKTEDTLKRLIIENGPVSGGISSLGHAMTLVGFQTDPVDGRTIWIFKNSWGKNWGSKDPGKLDYGSEWGEYWQQAHGEKNGYAYVKLEIDNIEWTHAVQTPITSKQSHQINCVDQDNDGYCNWGISKDKPSTCPASCKPEKDCDDSDAKKGPFDAKYNCPNINNEPDPQRPVASFKVLPDIKGEAPFTVTLDASASSDSDGKVVKYDWSQVRANTREKPTPIASNNNPTQTYTFNTAGQFEVILMVTDSQGLLAKDEAHNTVTVTGSQSQLIDLEAVEGKAFAWDNIGQPVKSGAILKGGISFNGGPYQKLVKFGDNLMGTLGHGEQAQSVIITGSITPDPKHACDKCADIFAFGEYFPYEEGKLGDNTCPPLNGKGAFYAMAKSYKNDRDNTQPRNYQLWDGKPDTLPILYPGVTLKAGEAVEYILYEGPFDARGCLNIGFGYRVKVGNDYEIVYNHHAATVDNTMGATIRKK